MSLRSAAGLLEFLVASRRALLAAPPPRPPATPHLHLVLGNEACDCDSVVSALAHAYRLHVERPPFLPPNALVAPVVSCTRASWPLRREAASLLAEALLGPREPHGGGEALADVLLFVDDAAVVDACAAAASAAARATVTLTDHNRLDGGGAALGLSDCDVVEIVDHHEDQGAHPHVAGAARLVAYDAAARRGVGSACTLVAAALLRGGGVDARLARLLLGVVLLDTCGLAPAAGKATEEDHRVAAALGERCGVGGAEGAALYGGLSALRFCADFWRALPPAVALAYDYKGFGEFGTAAICEPVGDFLMRGGGGGGGGALGGAPLTACAAAAAQRRHSLFLLLSMAPPDGARSEGAFLRQLAVVLPPQGAPGARRARHVLAQLRACALLQLREAAAGRTGEGWEAVLFEQGNAVASRKQVVPLVQEWLKGCGEAL